MKLEVKSITAGYGSQPILYDVSATFLPQQISAIIGPNGAGKSTLLKAIFGLIRIHGGTVCIDDVKLRRVVPQEMARRGVAYVPQISNVFPSLSVRENLEVGTYVRTGGSMDAVLEVFPDLKGVLGKSAGKLSGGQRNMLAVARALMSRPEVLLIDEPTAGLSPRIAETLWRHLQTLSASGISVVVVEQNVHLALKNAQDVYLLTSGRNRIHEPAARFADRPDLEALFLEAATDLPEEQEEEEPGGTIASPNNST